MSSDSYMRLTARGPRLGEPSVAGPDRLLFVDVDQQGEATPDYSGLRDVPYDVLSGVRWLVVRSIEPCRPADGDSAGRSGELVRLRQQVEDLQLRCGVVLLRQQLGIPAELEGDAAPEGLIERSRAAELEALLTWGHAVWRPTHYHYRLPSGEHAAGFIRLANAIREPRDAAVLASWLREHLSDGTGFVVDTGTLTPILLAAVADMHAAGYAPGSIAVLGSYPTTDFDVRRAVARARKRNSVVALLSVNSSGEVLERLLRALKDVGAGATQAVSVVVSKTPHDAHRSQVGDAIVDVWHPRPGQDPLVDTGVRYRMTCALCQDQETTTIVPINPETFDATLKAAVRTITPSVSDPALNRTLWEQCDRLGGIGIDVDPVAGVEPYRPPGKMPIRFDLWKMLSDPEFRSAVVKALRTRLGDVDPDVLQNGLECEVLLVPARELDYSGMTELIVELGPLIGAPDVKAFDLDKSWDQDLRDAVGGATSLAVLTLGTVTGTHLYQALAESQAVREPGELLTAIVLQPRMDEPRSWQTMENAFSHRIFYAWQSYVRDRSPIAEEAEVLDAFSKGDPADLSSRATEFLERRRRFCNEVDPDGEGLFWGSTPGQHLTPNSIYGKALKGPAVYAAVASAMERARKQEFPRAEPERRVFEMDAIARSYYDPLILSAMFRWLEPHEVWWGWQIDDGHTIVAQMVNRLVEPDQMLVLASELLLAAAQGKLSPPAVGELRAFAAPLVDHVAPELSGPLELGLRIAPEYRTSDLQRRRKRYERRLEQLREQQGDETPTETG